jgi:hypothetical protein
MATSEQALLAYVAAWSESDEQRRRALLETAWDENGFYSDPTVQLLGREALFQHIGNLIQKFADQRILLSSGISEHDGLIYFSWVRVGPDGRKIREGVDFGEMGSDNRFVRMIGFFGPFPTPPASWPEELVQP